uniref:G_PROTEIN_RECEP_F1_2 domain-containing protein n=1 Tax=Caenorhabditis tropicalis TaxID=1561998 RepID=A0A1I7TYP5_9PELO
MHNESNCQQMAEVATSPILRATLLVMFSCCLICIPVNIYALWRILISVKIHFNSKCVLLIHNFFVFIHLIARIALHGKDISNYYGSWTDGCDIIPSRNRCDLRYFYKYSTYIIEISPFVLMIERFVATFQARDYENRYKWFGIVLSFLHASLISSDVDHCFSVSQISLGALFMIIQTSTNSGEIIIFYCWLANTGNLFLVNVPTFFIFLSQLATIPGLLYLLKKNERFRENALHKHCTLTERYQISENLRTSSMFRIMSVVTWIYVFYNATGSYLFGRFWMRGMEYAEQFASVEVIHCIPMYYIILSILIIRVDRKPRNAFTIHTNHNQPTYFDELQKFFDEAFEKITTSEKSIDPCKEGELFMNQKDQNIVCFLFFLFLSYRIIWFHGKLS